MTNSDPGRAGIASQTRYTTELSDWMNKCNDLEAEKQKLIDEMRDL